MVVNIHEKIGGFILDILVVTNSCSQKKYDEICEKRIKPSIDPQQKFFRLMIEGLFKSNKGNVTALSALPVSASTVKKKKFHFEEDITDVGVAYCYLPFKNGKITRYLSLLFSARKYVKTWCKENNSKNAFIIVDPLVPVIAIPTRKVAQKLGFRVCAVVTDLPTLSTNMKERKESLIKKKLLSIYQKLADKDLRSYDAYVPLTKSINDVVNPKEKPYVIIEGFADYNDDQLSTVHDNYIMYAGGVYEKYGVKTLVEAFLKLKRNDIELHIFGEGSYTGELELISRNNPKVKYMGCVTSDKVVEYEKRALLLVNPRPTNETFSKFSFPSKTMEYLLSGTAVVSTKLPGIPEEYFDYMFSFDSDDRDSIFDKLNELLNFSNIELIDKGKLAHDFVLQNKNNVIMTSKIINLMTYEASDDKSI
jgi:glycosyltransferase, family 1